MDPAFGGGAPIPNVTEEDLNNCRSSIITHFNKVEKLEKQVIEVEKFYHTIKAQIDNVKDKDKGLEKHVTGSKRLHRGSSSRETNSSNTMQEVMQQFSTILNQITQHKWAGPFLDPVDVKGLGLHDYYEIIEKPMDFNTIKKRMNAKDGSGYKNVREIYSDVRLIFKNAMKYNDGKHDIHIRARSLLEKIEKKWLQLLPKVDLAESERLREEAHAQLETQLAQEATYAKMAKDISLELCDVEVHLKNLKEMVIEKCRKLSTREKLTLAQYFNKLNVDNLYKAMQIVSENDPTFQPNAQEVNIDFDHQSDYTLWKLSVFAKKALQNQEKAGAEEMTTVNHHNDNIEDKRNPNKRRKL
ncbi:hypothetical protein VNO78_04746 [Psophocarpus tetragonolobus]|uniref:Transcription factor GTE1 n=1 Tax=Psophocarpus tetragonolobus TaxID=3891 RepID=A0AAN9T632_PSOTE